MFSIEYRLAETDIDPVYQHVHHARFFNILEKARVELLKAMKCPIEDWISSGILIVVTKVKFDYKRELRESPLTVTCEQVVFEPKSVSIYQRIINPNGKDAFVGRIELKFMSLASRRAVPIPESFREQYRTMFVGRDI